MRALPENIARGQSNRPSPELRAFNQLNCVKSHINQLQTLIGQQLYRINTLDG